jgi:hypothetical protein
VQSLFKANSNELLGKVSRLCVLSMDRLDENSVAMSASMPASLSQLPTYQPDQSFGIQELPRF